MCARINLSPEFRARVFDVLCVCVCLLCVCVCVCAQFQSSTQRAMGQVEREHTTHGVEIDLVSGSADENPRQIEVVSHDRSSKLQDFEAQISQVRRVTRISAHANVSDSDVHELGSKLKEGRLREYQNMKYSTRLQLREEFGLPHIM
jgi:hypothetical protein